MEMMQEMSKRIEEDKSLAELSLTQSPVLRSLQEELTFILEL